MAIKNGAVKEQEHRKNTRRDKTVIAVRCLSLSKFKAISFACFLQDKKAATNYQNIYLPLIFVAGFGVGYKNKVFVAS